MSKRPICLASLGLIFGILGGLYLQNRKASPLFFLYGIILMVCLYVRFSKKEIRWIQRSFLSKASVILLLICTFCGFWYANWTIKEKYSWEFDGKTVSFSGKVIAREIKNKKERYVLKLDKLDGKRVRIKVQVQCQENGKSLWELGSRITGKGEWQDFSPSRNEGTFDEKTYFMSQGISGKISFAKAQGLEEKQPKTWIWAIKEEREKFGAFLEKHLGEKQSALGKAIFIRR